MAKDRTTQDILGLQLRRARRRRRLRIFGKGALITGAGVGAFFGGRAIARSIRSFNPLLTVGRGLAEVGSGFKGAGEVAVRSTAGVTFTAFPFARAAIGPIAKAAKATRKFLGLE